jgi:hypothetical protein
VLPELRVVHSEVANGTGFVFENLTPQFIPGGSWKRNDTCEGFVERCAERPDVGAFVDVTTPGSLLRRQIRGRAQNRPCVRQATQAVAALVSAREAEIQQFRLYPVAGERDEDVIGLNVAMNDPLGVCRHQSVRDRQQHAYGMRGCELPHSNQPVREALAAQQLHHEER